MLGVTLAIMFAGSMVADAIMFVNGYKSWIFHAKTEQEKLVRSKWFADRNLDWDGKQ